MKEFKLTHPHDGHKWQKVGLIYNPKKEANWWHSHAMAPTAVTLDDGTIRVYMGGWSKEKIAQIGYIDLCATDPSKVLSVSKEPVVEVGRPGTFDENGVFPAHATKLKDGIILLHYTGFQLSVAQEVDHYNFGGLAISTDGGNTFKKVSEAPILDRADEGLFVRAGLSVWEEADSFKCIYSAGCAFDIFGGKLRPYYEVFYQESKDGINFEKQGKKIISLDKETEHGLGRPQIFKIDDTWYAFYTRRTIDMRYRLGASYSSDLQTWERCDDWVGIPHGKAGEFDEKMVYFPSVVKTNKGNHFLFYCGNGYGRDGFGYAKLVR